MLALPHLLGTCLSSLWSPPFPPHAPVDPSLSRQGAAIAHLDSLTPCDLDRWLFFHFLLVANEILAYLPTTHFVALRPPVPFRQAHFVSLFAKACAILQALRRSRQQLELTTLRKRKTLERRKVVLFTLSNSFDNRGVLIWFLAALSLAFRYCKIFFGAVYNTSAIIGLS